MSRERPRYTHYPRPVLWLVPGGRTTIGGDEPASQPRFEVEVEPFYLSQQPITNEQMEAFEPAFERSPLSPGDEDAALGVSFEAASEYCRWYAEVSRKPMRLPTEVEWEHACRAGSAGKWYWGDDDSEADDHLWDARNFPGRLPPLGSKRSNGFGLHAMLGGVWEWTASVPRPYPLDGASHEAQPPEARRVLRGGSFRLDRSEISCSLRRPESIDLVADDVGFRVAKSLR